MRLILIRVLVSNLFVSDLQMLRWLTFWLLQALIIYKDNLFRPCFMCDRLAVSFVCFSCTNTVYIYDCSETLHLCLRLIVLGAKISVLFFVCDV